MPRAQLEWDPRIFELVRKEFTQPIGFIWAREVFQNAFDERASSLEFRTGEDARGPWIEATDDGPGMATVQNMLRIGAATKVGKRGGGFGTAKKVILLTWPHWELVSGRERLTKEILDARAEIQTLEEPFPGTRLRIWHDGDIDVRDVRNYLRLTNGIRTSIDGMRVPTFRKGSQSSTTDGLEVYTNGGDKAPAPGFIVVRSEGIAMFTTPIGRDDIQVTVQLTRPSTEMLTETRESLHSPWRYDLWDIRQELEKNALSAGTVNRPDEFQLFVGDGDVKVRGDALEPIVRDTLPTRHRGGTRTDQPAPEQVAGAITARIRAGGSLEAVTGAGADPNFFLEVARALPEDVRSAFEQWVGEGVQQMPAEGTVEGPPPNPHGPLFAPEANRPDHPLDRGRARQHFGSDQNLAPKKKSPRSLYPRDFAVKRVAGRTCRLDLIGERYARMLFAWEAAVEAALKSLVDSDHYVPEGRRRFRVGFVVEGDQRAEYMYTGGEQFFLLNPRVIQVSEGLTETAKRLHQLATHEVAHIVFGSHGEDFTSLWGTLLMETSLVDLRRDDRVRCLLDRSHIPVDFRGGAVEVN